MDAQYTALARRFRPTTFTEVVGQERIARTLRNAIRENRVAHAYLFTGARGVGKTSMARIFAKALNCPNIDAEGNPCNQCEICQSIAAGQDVDVSEIDGASNRRIDDIRMLRANVGVKSMRSRYKIYIIDEVHMLTGEAFNALLKTLEEPPPGVKFVFCTTDPQKIPDTILSRCQKFDFGTISVDNISTRLQQLADAEEFQVEPAAIELVARRAAGSMRDSQSLFDQLLAFGSKTITSDDVHRLLGTAPEERIISLVNALIERNRAEALGLLEQSLNDGMQLEALTDQLVGYFRDLMVTACGATDATLLSVGTSRRKTLQDQASRWGLQTIIAGMQILADTKARMQRVTFGRALAELALTRISLLEDLDRLDELVIRLKSGAQSSLPPSRLSSPSPTLPADPTAGEKKNDVIPQTREIIDQADQNKAKPLSAPQEFDQAASQEITPEIEWKPGCENELRAAILTRFNDMTGTHLNRVSRTAISGPTQLDFFFPANYDLDRRQCDRPEVVHRIEKVVEQLVGRRIRVRFLLGEMLPEEPAKATPVSKSASAKSRIVEEPTDPYLQEMMSVLGIKGWKVQSQGLDADRGPDGARAEE